MKRTANMPDSEPEEIKRELPSQKEHLLQVTNVYTPDDNPFENGLPKDTVSAQLEVVGGDEEGRTLLSRMTLDENGKGFWATRLFLKAIGEPHKGKGIEMDTDRWIGRQLYATVKHNGQYANIADYNFDKPVEQYKAPVGNPGGITDPKDIQWQD